MKASENPVVGRWRIIEADLWDRDYLDLCGPATLVVKASGHGEIAFGAMQASLDIDYGPAEIGFTWDGFDEMDEVSEPAPPSFRMTDPSRSSSTIISEMRPSSKPSATLLQYPASVPGCRRAW